MGTLSENGITVECTSETLLRIFKLMTIDECVIRERFREGIFADLYSRNGNSTAVRFAVLWDEGRGRAFLFKLQTAGHGRWEAVSVIETCAGHSFAEGVVLKKHVVHAANVFYFSRRSKKRTTSTPSAQPVFPVLRSGAA